MIGEATTAQRTGHTVVIVAMCIVLFMTALWSLSIGAMVIPLSDVSLTLLHTVGLFKDYAVQEVNEVVLTSIRLPRIVMTVLIGGALGVSGAALQGLFSNPLVEPSLIGVSSGAAAGVVMMVVFGAGLALPTVGIYHDLMLPIAAFSGGLTATYLVLTLSLQMGRMNIAVLVLVGVAVNALAGAIIGLAIFYADENQLRTFTFWTLGDLGGATWSKLMIAGPLLVGAVGGLSFFGRSLNGFVLGEAEAFHMGVDVERAKRLIVFFSAVGVGTSVSLAGMIGFVGLVVPHLVRVIFNADNTLVLPASILGGAWLLIVADVVARTVVTPAELPIGVVTALIGSPFFIALLMKAKYKSQI